MKWRNAYIQGGLAGLLSHNWKGNRPSVIKPDQREALRLKLREPGNGLRGFTELLAWFNKQFNEEVNYSTMNKFVKRNYGASVRSPASHMKKDRRPSRLLKNFEQLCSELTTALRRAAPV
ncbi:MAG: helix-turn-helix domain-containing protein [Flavobacteriales bacterium]|nr:helix-turn-helix domain-containing protein [Flavobacteriales bacterium]